MNKKRGFTLLEVLITVAILGLVATGSLRLMMISSRVLIEVEETRELLNEARKIQLDFMTNETKPTSGTEKGFRWEVSEGAWPVLDGRMELKYKELKVETKTNEIVLYMPYY